MPAGELLELDQWILLRAENLVEQCRAWYEELAFHKVYQAVYDFAITDLSALYFDVLKDRLYTAAPQSRARRSAQTALYRLTYALVRLLAPLLTLHDGRGLERTCGKPAGEAESVHLALFPEPGELTAGLTAQHRKRAKNWDRLMEVRDHVLKSLEAARQEKFIGAPLEAAVHLKADGDLYPLLEQYAAELAGAVHRLPGEAGARTATRRCRSTSARAEGVKCERCWKYTTDVGSVAELPTVCAACAAARRRDRWRTECRARLTAYGIAAMLVRAGPRHEAAGPGVPGRRRTSTRVIPGFFNIVYTRESGHRLRADVGGRHRVAGLLPDWADRAGAGLRRQRCCGRARRRGMAASRLVAPGALAGAGRSAGESLRPPAAGRGDRFSGLLHRPLSLARFQCGR